MPIIFIKSFRFSLIAIFASILLLGCSSGGGNSIPVVPDTPAGESNREIPGLTENPDTQAQSESGHYLMLYNLICIDATNPDDVTAEIIPLREGMIHLNILKFLEGAPCFDCFRIVGFNFPGPGYQYLNVDIRIDHPFSDLLFSVFDVRGIMMFDGTHVFPSTGKTTSDPTIGEGAILNTDGYTALYNGSTLNSPAPDLQKYLPGKLSTETMPNSDINGYIYFRTDDPANNRNAFYANSFDVKTFSMKLPSDNFVIGYAVDASWGPPTDTPVDDPLTDFDTNANCPEPWKVVVTEEPIGNGLTDHGGQTKLLIDVYDWQGKSTHHTPQIESPEIFDGILNATWVSDEADFTRYEVNISNDNLAPIGNYQCLIGVEAIENDPANTPWLDLTAYQCCSLQVVHIEPGGDLFWAKRAGGLSNDSGGDIITLPDNSIVMTGYFMSSATFGPDEPNETVLNSAVGRNTFIAQYNPDGSLAWVRNAEAANTSQITLLSDNSTVITGYYGDPATFGPGEANETVLISDGNLDIFIARYNPDGSLAWAKRTGGTSYDLGQGIAALSDNSFVVTGQFGDTVTFGEGDPNESILSSAGARNIFIARYNPDGSIVWAKRAGGEVIDRSTNVLALFDDSMIVVGRFMDSATFGPGEPNETILDSAGDNDIFVARYNPDGSLAWVKQAGGYLDDAAGNSTALSDSTVVVIGRFEGSATFGKGEPNETVLTSAGNKDIFIALFDSDGSLAWAKRAGGLEYDNTSGITSYSDNSTVISGAFEGSTTFGPGEPNETILNSEGMRDIFIAKYNPDGSFVWVKHIGSAKSDGGSGITTLSDNSIVATGAFYYSVTFGPGEPNETVLESTGYMDIFVARFAP